MTETALGRRQKIIQHLNQMHVASYGQIGEFFGVSEMTARRDVEALAQMNLVTKIKGGARTLSVPESYFETSLSRRLTENIPEKEAIAKLALQFIKPGEPVFLDGGTSCVRLAHAMTELPFDFTAITFSLLVAAELKKLRKGSVICVGGQLDKEAMILAGPLAEAQLGGLYFSKAFFSTKGFSVTEGTFESEMPRMNMKRIAAERSDEVYLLVDHTKFAERSIVKVLPIERINHVITDAGVPESEIETLSRMGIEVHVASVSATAHK